MQAVDKNEEQKCPKHVRWVASLGVGYRGKRCLFCKAHRCPRGHPVHANGVVNESPESTPLVSFLRTAVCEEASKPLHSDMLLQPFLGRFENP